MQQIKLYTINKEKVEHLKNVVNKYFEEDLKDIEDIKKEARKNIEEMSIMEGSDIFKLLIFQQFKLLSESFQVLKQVSAAAAQKWLEYSRDELKYEIEDLKKIFDKIDKLSKMINENKNKDENYDNSNYIKEMKEYGFILLNSIQKVDENIIDKDILLKDYKNFKEQFNSLDLMKLYNDNKSDLFANIAMYIINEDDNVLKNNMENKVIQKETEKIEIKASDVINETNNQNIETNIDKKENKNIQRQKV